MLLHLLDLLGTIAFAITGALAAIRHRMDLSGAVVLGFIVGNGGGTIRDLILNRPVFWLHDESYIYVTICTALVMFLIAYLTPVEKHHRAKSFAGTLIIADAIGLGAFTIIGMDKAFGVGFGPTIAVMMGMLTAVGGGVLRDVLCREIPMIFRGQLYATPALIGAIVYSLIDQAMPHQLAILTCLTFITGLRLIAYNRDWHLPFVG